MFQQRVRIYLALAMIAAVSGGAWLLHEHPTWRVYLPSDSAVIARSTPPITHLAPDIGDEDPHKPMKIVVCLKPRHESELNALLDRQADENSADFQKWLTPEQFADRFGAEKADYDLVAAYLRHCGLTVYTYSGRLAVVADGTAGQVKQAFNVNLRRYSYMGEVKCSNSNDPSVPEYLNPIVSHIDGLDDFGEYHSLSEPQANATQPEPSSLTPKKIATAYNFPNQNNLDQAIPRYTGKGCTVGIATAYACDPPDNDLYWKTMGVVRTGTTTAVPIGGPLSVSAQSNETTIDVQQVGAQAPGADIRIYVGATSSFTNFEQGTLEAIQDRVQILSISWGLCEKNAGLLHMVTHHLLFKQAAAQGIAVFVASGDHGAYDCNTIDLSIDHPSSNPYVTAVGGTSLELGPDHHRKNEVAWKGAGGGSSITWTKPTWQIAPGLPASLYRQTADVSLVSDPSTGYARYFRGQWQTYGGTSFAAPNWAALWALAEEATGRTLGPANPLLYHLSRTPAYNSVFYDVIKGSNPGSQKGPGFTAGPGWDAPTGLGVPNGWALIQALKELGHRK